MANQKPLANGSGESGSMGFLHPSNKRKSAPLMTGPTFPEIVMKAISGATDGPSKVQATNPDRKRDQAVPVLIFAGAAADCCFLFAQLDPCQWQEQSSSQDMLAVQFVRIGE